MRILLALLAALPLAASAQAVLDGRRCATPEPTVFQMLEAQRATAGYRAAGAFLRVDDGPITVPVAVHVVRAGPTAAQGDVPRERIEAQLDTLNAAFAHVGLRFTLALLDRVDNAEWYDGLGLGSPEEGAMKRALARDPARVLNLYTVSPSLDFLGWATLPDSYPEGDDYDGVVVLDQSLPGGAAAPYDLGHTGTHEVGHWAGLAHTFQGGCSSPNDGVADTPQERSGASGCPTTRDSCPADPGLDPVHNFMDYSDDACMTEFTPGQAERVRAMVGTYRPTLAARDYAVALAAEGTLATALVGVEETVEVWVTNVTAAALTVTGAEGEGAEATLAPTAVPSGATVRLPVAVRPTARGAIAVTLTTDAGVPAGPLRLEGFATRPPTARLADEPASGRLIEDAAVVETVTLANDGEGALTFALDAGALPPWVADVSPASGTVASGEAVEIAVTFSSAGLAPGAVEAAVVFATNDPLRRSLAVPVALEVLPRPLALAAGRVFPNPTRGPVTVPLELPEAAAVWAEALDLRGRVVAVLADGAELPAGYPELTWDASGLAPGLYLVRVRTETAAALARVTLTR